MFYLRLSEGIKMVRVSLNKKMAWRDSYSCNQSCQSATDSFEHVLLTSRFAVYFNIGYSDFWLCWPLSVLPHLPSAESAITLLYFLSGFSKMQHFSVLLNLNVHKTVAGHDCFCKYIMHNINVYCECCQDKDFHLKEIIAALAINSGRI